MWTPYVGAGVGPDWVNVKGAGTAAARLSGDTLVGGYQGIVGVSAQLDPNWSVTADYRYISSLDAKVGASTGGNGRIENTSNNVVLGVRYSFGGEQAQEPMHTAVAPTVSSHAGVKPPVAGQAQNFMVFFDFNKATLTPEAKRIIASAAQEFKRTGSASITVTGHTDTVGKPGYNEKLSQKRAAAVEAELKKLGVSTKHIQATGVGKDGLLVPTADGVREAQNRRAEIVLSK
jgi:outer membrane protein OmpA-like peptidoglycan-associated protein